MPKKAIKDLGKLGLGLGATGIGLGIGAGLVSDAGGDPTAVTNISGKLGTIGTIGATGIGLGLLVDSTKKLNKKLK